MTSPYSLTRVDNKERLTASLLREMHGRCFPNYPMIEVAVGDWWIAYASCGAPAAFCALWPSVHASGVRGYLARSAVLPGHRGKGLQRRMIRVRERRARTLGWLDLVTDTNNDNPASANNMIRCGYHIWNPPIRWGNETSIYWRKLLAKGMA